MPQLQFSKSWSNREDEKLLSEATENIRKGKKENPKLFVPTVFMQVVFCESNGSHHLKNSYFLMTSAIFVLLHGDIMEIWYVMPVTANMATLALQ